MLRSIFTLFVGAFFSLSVAANDPFDKTRRNAVNPKESVKETVNATPQCHKVTDALFPTTPFNQISVIGVLQHKQDWQLMLLADNQVSLAKPGDVIATENLRIEKIGKQEIQFLRWDNPQNCGLTTPLNIKF